MIFAPWDRTLGALRKRLMVSDQCLLAFGGLASRVIAAVTAHDARNVVFSSLHIRVEPTTPEAGPAGSLRFVLFLAQPLAFTRHDLPERHVLALVLVVADLGIVTSYDLVQLGVCLARLPGRRRDNWEQMSERQRWPYYEVADVMLAAFCDSGYVIVERPTEERLAFVRDPDDQGDEE